MRIGRSVRILPWTLWGCFVAVLITAIYVGGDQGRPTDLLLLDIIWAVSFVGFPTTGALIARRMPDRPLGWIFLIAPLLLIGGVAVGEWAQNVNSTPPVSTWGAWVANVIFGLGMPLFLVIPYLLPNGKPPGGKARWLPRGAVAVGLGAVLVNLFAPARPGEYPTGANPAEIEPLSDLLRSLQPAFDVGMLLVLLVGVATVVVRHRRSEGVARLQSKWIAVGAGVVALGLGLIPIVDAFVDEVPGLISTPLSVVAILAFPVTIGIAMLRYRLYDVDLVINRALVYGGLTALLGAIYLGLVLLLQAMVSPFTAESDVAVAASTLAVAGLFRPLRGRLQTFIDRRFYRQRYDAAQALTSFGSRLRDQIELDALRGDITGVVAETVQPTHVSVWVREAP